MTDPGERLEYLRSQIEAESMSWGEIAELQSLAEHIDPGDVQLLEWAGVPEPITMDYTPELWDDIMVSGDYVLDYFQTGWTVCGAEDPAVIYLPESFDKKHPELAGYTVVRVIDKYVNPSKSDTLLEFSNRGITDEEYAQFDQIADEED